MVRIAVLLFSLALVGQAQDFSLDRLFTRPYVWGTSPSQVTWAKRAHVLGFLWNAQGQAFRDLYVYNADSKVLKRLTDLESLKDPINDGEAERDIHRQDYLPPRAGLAGFEYRKMAARRSSLIAAIFSWRPPAEAHYTASPKQKRQRRIRSSRLTQAVWPMCRAGNFM
jgi:hypothetical protein